MTPHLASSALRQPVAIALAALLLCTNAQAFRPFDGTDADVAEPGEIEVAVGIGRTRLGSTVDRALPALDLTFGVAPDTEISIEGQLAHGSGTTDDGPHTRLDDMALSMKNLWVHGSLQDGTGPSLATECGLLLPNGHGDSHLGGECSVLVSQRWDVMALHLKLGAGRTRQRTNTGSVSLIAEGPATWVVRPVAEWLTEHEAGSRVDSALVGAIWQHDEDLAIDVGLRRAHTDEGALNEVRIGFTWSVATGR